MGTARNIAAAQTKKLREYVKPREYLPGEASLRVRNISERRCIYGAEKRAEMNRLTQWIDENRAIPRVDLRRCGHERCTTQLARYEDTGLTPEQIMELKERDTAKAPVDIDEEFDMYVCPSCNMAIGAMGDREEHKFCLNCGQRLRWEE